MFPLEETLLQQSQVDETGNTSNESAGVGMANIIFSIISVLNYKFMRKLVCLDPTLCQSHGRPLKAETHYDSRVLFHCITSDVTITNYRGILRFNGGTSKGEAAAPTIERESVLTVNLLQK